MSKELEAPSKKLGKGIANAVAPLGEPLPDRATIEERLTKVFETLQQGDQVSVNTIRQFIQENSEWAVSVVQPKSKKLVCIDTYFTQEDGTVVYISVATPLPPNVAYVEGVRRDEVIDFVKTNAEWASAWYHTPEAVEALLFDAVPGQDLVAILRGDYERVKRIEIETEESRYRPPHASDRIHSLMWNEDAIIGTSVPLKTEVEAEAPDHYLRLAQDFAAQAMANIKTQGAEYRELHNRLRHGEDVTVDEQKKLYDRLMEIQAQNGFPDSPLDWRTVVPQWLEEEIGLLKDTDLWNEHVVEGLRTYIGEQHGLFLYERAVRVRSITAKTIQIAQITGQSPMRGAISSSDSNNPMSN